MRSRRMAKLQSIILSEAMDRSPDRSQMDLFLEFVAELTSLQKQLYVRYHGERYLRDQLLS